MGLTVYAKTHLPGIFIFLLMQHVSGDPMQQEQQHKNFRAAGEAPMGKVMNVCRELLANCAACEGDALD